MLLCWIIKLLSIPSADKYSKKHFKVCEADALKQVDANVREGGNKNCSSLYYSNSNSDTATKKMRIKAREREARLDSLLDSDDYCLDSSLDINSKDNLEDEEATTAKDLLTTVYSANKQTRIRDSFSARKNKVVIIDPANSILCNLSDLLVVRFCIFSDLALENIGILINKEVFALVCSFRKVDRHMFRANNTISGRTVFNEFYNCKLEGIIIAKFYKDLRKYN
ncbi:hypothetical protein HBI20_249410 [Parastagonospora nodorum]|nr:hypothetical protein HBI20_249410 [Parastagonospora nodorum]